MALGGRRWRRLRIAVPLILLVMILMRLVWMQLRSYPVLPESRALISLDVLRRSTGVVCDRSRPQTRPLVVNPANLEGRPPEKRRQLAAAYDWLASPGYAGLAYAGCQSDLSEERQAIKLNQWILAATVLMATLMARFMTSSWTIALIVASMLMSRGQLLADIGMVSSDYPVMLLITTWLACSAHFLRTGAAASVVLAAVAAVVGALFDRSLVVLCLAMPILLLGGFLDRRRLARPVIRRLRGTSRRMRLLSAKTEPDGSVWAAEDEGGGLGRFARSMRYLLGMEFPPGAGASWRPSYERGTLLRTINVPFLLWVYWKRRWLKLSLGWLGFGLFTAMLLALVYWALSGETGTLALRQLLAQGAGPRWELNGWTAAFMQRFDLHLATSLVVIALCAWQSPAAGLSSFLECVWLALIAGLLLVGAAFLADAVDFGLVRGLIEAGIVDPLALGVTPRPVMLWLEPAILSLGVAGVYNLMKVLDTRMAEKG